MVRRSMEIRPITFRDASDFINRWHRHHRATVGCKFCIGLYDREKIIGCAVCGRPVARYLDDGLTCEINRLCTDGTYNACSMLYAACCRTAIAMGYKVILTYILQSETGASLKASGFYCDGIAGGISWSGVRRRDQSYPYEMKTKWIRKLR